MNVPYTNNLVFRLSGDLAFLSFLSCSPSCDLCPLTPHSPFFAFRRHQEHFTGDEKRGAEVSHVSALNQSSIASMPTQS